MTADWRATLERVAELLDKVTGFDFGDADRITKMRSLVRGLLAEPQPDERCVICDGPAYRDATGTTRCAKFAPPGLAEPQVNPSEVKDREIADLRKVLKEIKRVAAIEAPPVSDEVPAKVWKLAFDALDARPGLLAEGEESREP